QPGRGAFRAFPDPYCDARHGQRRARKQPLTTPILLFSRRQPAQVSKRSDVPSRKEIQWSQLKVGALVLAAIVILIGLIFLMTGSSGGLFARKIVLRSYFPNAAGLKEGAPVTLEGV